MKISRLSESTFSTAFGIQMAGLDTLAGESGLGVSYGIVEPGGESTFHCHDESELFVIISGSGVILVDGAQTVEVAPGDVISFGSFETHVIRNTAKEKLTFADLYWRDPARAARAAAKNGSAGLSERPVFVFSTPPTPNGDLHLGHLSGPYLGADVFTRFQRMLGNEAYHITGSDDFQSYVISKARQLATDPPSVAARFAAEIKETLDMMDVHIDQFTITSRAEGYENGLKEFFHQVCASGQVRLQRQAATFDSASGAYVYEPDISGQCPSCGSSCGGNICEECGEPNVCVDLVNAVAKPSGKPPVLRELERYTLPLGEFKDHVLKLLGTGKAAPRLHTLADRVFARENLSIPVTHPQAWGVQPTGPAPSGQVIWVWPEMSYGFLYGIEALGRRINKDWQALKPQDHWKIVHFFGYDNSFYHSILYPALYALAFPEWSPDIDYNMNEFYLLEGLKFSTSRQHAVWGKDVLNPDSVDCVRYHLCLTRGEVERTNFDREALARTNDAILSRWDNWLRAVGATVAARYGGHAPDAGDWTADHRAFLAVLEARRANVEAALSPDGFSLNRAAAELDGLVNDVLRFSFAQQHLAGLESAASRNRTVIALELAAARLLMECATPIMPRFAQRLRSALGLAAEPSWPRTVTLVPPGTRIDLANSEFFPAKAQTSPGDTISRLEGATV